MILWLHTNPSKTALYFLITVVFRLKKIIIIIRNNTYLSVWFYQFSCLYYRGLLSSCKIDSIYHFFRAEVINSKCGLLFFFFFNLLGSQIKGAKNDWFGEVTVLDFSGREEYCLAWQCPHLLGTPIFSLLVCKSIRRFSYFQVATLLLPVFFFLTAIQVKYSHQSQCGPFVLCQSKETCEQLEEPDLAARFHK